jgi:hypothetical protein
VPMPNRNRLKKIKDMSWAIGPYCVLLDSGGRRLFNNKGLGGSSRGAQAPQPQPPKTVQKREGHFLVHTYLACTRSRSISGLDTYRGENAD